jgi:exportin-7
MAAGAFPINRYAALPSPLALENLVSLGSLRRSLFSSDEERLAFLHRMLNGTLALMRGQVGLTDHDNHHELCRLLARLKANFQLSELVSCPSYASRSRLT